MQISLCLYFLHADTLDFLVTDKFLEEGIIHFLSYQVASANFLRNLVLRSVFYPVLICVSLAYCNQL